MSFSWNKTWRKDRFSWNSWPKRWFTSIISCVTTTNHCYKFSTNRYKQLLFKTPTYAHTCIIVLIIWRTDVLYSILPIFGLPFWCYMQSYNTQWVNYGSTSYSVIRYIYISWILCIWMNCLSIHVHSAENESSVISVKRSSIHSRVLILLMVMRWVNRLLVCGCSQQLS